MEFLSFCFWLGSCNFSTCYGTTRRNKVWSFVGMYVFYYGMVLALSKNEPKSLPNNGIPRCCLASREEGKRKDSATGENDGCTDDEWESVVGSRLFRKPLFCDKCNNVSPKDLECPRRVDKKTYSFLHETNTKQISHLKLFYISTKSSFGIRNSNTIVNRKYLKSIASLKQRQQWLL